MPTPKPPKPSIEKRYTLDKRVYHITEKKKDGFKEDWEGFLHSVTSICGATEPPSFILDRYKAEEVESKGIEGARFALYMSAERGTTVHKAIEKWNQGQDLFWFEEIEDPDTKEVIEKKNYDDFEWKAIRSYMSWAEEFKPKFKELEIELYSKTWGYAGTADAVAEIGGQTVICDWKSGKYIGDKFYLQAAAYWKAYEEMTGITCDAAMILALSVPPSPRAKVPKTWKLVTLNREDLEKAWNRFQTRMRLFYETHPKEDFEPKRDLLPVSYTH